MNDVIQVMYVANKKVLREPKYFLLFTLSAIIFFSLFVLIPLVTIPGNDLAFQWQVYGTNGRIFLIFLALLTGLGITLEIYNFKNRQVNGKTENISQSVIQGSGSTVAGVFGSIVGTASCASCLASLFGLIGLGSSSVFFVLKNQSYFLIGAIGLMIISLYFAARKVNKVCASC